MAYDNDALIANIVATVGGAGSFSGRINTLVDHCEQQFPHKQWGALRRVDYEADGLALGHWLVTALAEADSGASFNGLWFGLNNPVINGRPTADIYVCASTKYEDASIDWAAEATFYPASRYLNSRVLSAIYLLAYSRDHGLGNDAEYPLALAYGAMVARTALESANLGGPFALLCGAAVGFDSGDYLRIGSFHNGRFRAKIEASDWLEKDASD
jgi:hypothetical protein